MNLKMALGGALPAELALIQRVGLAGPGERVTELRLIVRDAGPTGDSMLDEALATVGRKEGTTPRNVVATLGKGARVRLYERLAAAGRLLGFIPTHRWPAEHTGHEESVREGRPVGDRHATGHHRLEPVEPRRTIGVRDVTTVRHPVGCGSVRRERNAAGQTLGGRFPRGRQEPGP